MPKKQASEAQEEGFDAGKEEVVALGVEVGHVVGALEIDAPEAPEADEYAAMDDRIEDRNVVRVADIFDGLGCLPIHGLRDVPGGDETDLGRGEFLLQAGAKNVQFGAKELRVFAVAVHQHGIVVPADNDHIISRFREVGVALVHGRTELFRLPLVGYTTAVPAPVVVLHVVFTGQLVVPGVFDGIGGVLDVAVAENEDILSVERGMEDGFRGVKARLRKQNQLLLRECVHRQE